MDREEKKGKNKLSQTYTEEDKGQEQQLPEESLGGESEGGSVVQSPHLGP